MKCISLFVLFSIFTFGSSAQAQFRFFRFNKKPLPLAYVYTGPGICKGCDESLIEMLENARLKVKLIHPGEITQEVLSHAALFAVPGGDDTTIIMNSLQKSEVIAIQNFVETGGRYLGICLGAFLAAHGFDLFDGNIHSYSATKEARMEKIKWRGKSRWMYFQDGPEFHPAQKSAVDIWGYYADGSIAALQANHEKGRIGLIGPHPEADKEWLKIDHLIDPDGSDEPELLEFVKALMGSEENSTD